MKATQLRPGMVIQHQGELFAVFSVEHRTPGNKRGAMQTRMPSRLPAAATDSRSRPEIAIDRRIPAEINFESLHGEAEGTPFMNLDKFEQVALGRDLLGDAVEHLPPNLAVKLEFFENKPLGVELPDTVDLAVVETEPAIQKATASSVMKPAKLETGLTIQVPPFINIGDKVRVDTSEGRYVQRAQ